MSATAESTGKHVPQGFKHHAEMVLVKEMTEETKHVELVVDVCVVQLLKNLQLLQTSLVPSKADKHMKYIIPVFKHS